MTDATEVEGKMRNCGEGGRGWGHREQCIRASQEGRREGGRKEEGTGSWDDERPQSGAQGPASGGQVKGHAFI